MSLPKKRGRPSKYTEAVATAFPEHPPYGGVFDEVVPDLADRPEPLLLEVAVVPDETFAP